jgi:hypothetical protein
MARLIEIKTDWKVPPTASQHLTQIHSYWSSRDAGGWHCPSRQHINPRDLSGVLRYLFLVDAKPDGDFCFRLAGSHFTDATGMAMSGQRISEVFPALFCEEAREAWRYAAGEVSPVLGCGRMWRPEKDFLNWEGIVMPLAEPGQRVNMLFGAIEFCARL